jgi:thiol-disulfide isomerase/thioredoxin
MKLSTAIIAFTFGLSLYAAEVSDSPAADATWAELVKSIKAPQASPQLADQLRDFYQKYPNHAKASSAWVKEQSLRQAAAGAPKPAPAVAVAPPATVDHSLAAQVHQAKVRINKAHQHSPEAALGEMERSGRKLVDQFPKDPAGWMILADAAQGFGGEKARQLYGLIAAKAPTAELKRTAADRLIALHTPAPSGAPAQRVARPSGPFKPLSLAFTATDGRAVDLSQMAGKVVLIDFWATWCGPCLAEIPNVKKAYNELHEKGFEIIGVSFDNDIETMKKFVAVNEMPWPQYCDGGGWKSAINKDFAINAIPTMYLVDKNGVLRETDARVGLIEKVRALLNE